MLRNSKHPSLIRRLVFGSFAVVVMASAAAAWMIAERTMHRAEAAQAEVLNEVAWVVARLEAARGRPSALSMKESDFAASFLAKEGETPAGTVVTVRMLEGGGASLKIVLEETLSDGTHTIEIDGEPWRVRLQTLKTGRHIAVAQPLEVLERTRRAAVFQAVMPVAFSALAVLFFGGILFAGMTEPVRRLVNDIRVREPSTTTPFSDEGLPAEAMPLVSALNELLARVDAFRRREARFSADAAHELRTPVAALRLEAERLERAAKTPDERDALERLLAGIDRLSRMVSQLLTFQRAQADGMNGVRANLLEALGEATSLVWPEIEAVGADFAAEGFERLEGTPVTLPVTPEALTGLFRNLLENAARYAARGASAPVRIRVCLESVDPLRVSVSDNGPGIPPEDCERVFEPFQRGIGTGIAGTGLGLAIVRETAMRAGLVVRLEDAAPGLRVVLEAKTSSKA